MKTDIPFQLGMQYENWEFDLEPINDRINGYDSYLYQGKELNYFMNYSTDKTELIFHWDRLQVVILYFDRKSISFYNKLNKNLIEKSPNLIVKSNSHCIETKFVQNKVNYWSIYFILTKEIRIIYFATGFPYINKILE